MSRTYARQQNCPIARSLDIVGDRWTLLLIRDLARGHTKFADLLKTLSGISPTVLSDRLQHLEREGLLGSSLYSEHPPRLEYALTEKGEAVRPVLEALLMWGNQWAPRRQTKAERSAPLPNPGAQIEIGNAQTPAASSAAGTPQ